jgi:energy-coupling factor transporter ATP-binding protein EcfA2
VRENVQLGLQLDARWTPPTNEHRIAELLGSVGLDQYAERHPSEISGGQRQRVAIARALAVGPQILLADEPTASLDRDTGRQIVRLLEQLARQQGVTVLLVTHDTRILDVADRILALEDGRLSSFLSAVTEETRHLWGFLARDVRHSELVREMRGVEPAGFPRLLEQVTRETREFLSMVQVAQSETFHSILTQVLEAFARKAGEVVGGAQTRIYRVDPERSELVCAVADPHDSAASACPASACPAQRRVPIARGIAGRAAASGTPVHAAPAEADPHFAADTDLGTAQGVHHLLAVPLRDSLGRAFAVLELGRGAAAADFEPDAEQRLDALARGVSELLEAWRGGGRSLRFPIRSRSPDGCPSRGS